MTIKTSRKTSSVQASHDFAELFPVSKRPWFFKYAEQAFAIVAIILLSPVFLLIGLLVKLDSKGPIFYGQTRAGKNRRKIISRPFPMNPNLSHGVTLAVRQRNAFGKPFTVWKFRSMRQNAEVAGQPIWCGLNDPRITRVGKILRKTHLDELPQLWNIVRGEMSIVGPRPERPEIISELARVIPGYERRLLVRPGVTGLAQVRHRADINLDDVKKKIRYDLFYLRRRTFWTDVRILLETIPVSLGYRPKEIRRMRKRHPIGKFFNRSVKAVPPQEAHFSELFSLN